MSDPILSQVQRKAFEHRVEILSAIILSLATVMTAWCGYQASRWGGLQAENYSKASSARVQAAQKANQALLQDNIQVSLFTQYVSAQSQGNQKLADYLYHHFPADLKVATDAWLATD